MVRYAQLSPTVILALCLLSMVPAALGSRQLRVMAIGQVLPGESPIPLWFNAEPLVDYVLIPTDADFQVGFGFHEWQRFVHLYFPRTREDLVEGFDFFVFPDGILDPFTSGQIVEMQYAIEMGLGAFVTMGGGLSNPSGSVYPSWVGSVLAETLPVELNPRMKQIGGAYRIEVVKEEPPVLEMFIPLGIKQVPGGLAFTHLFSREGATTWADIRSQRIPAGMPDDWLVSRRYGESGGLVWAVADDLDCPWWSSVYGPTQNEYAGDIFINILLHSIGAPLPQDVSQLHRLRGLYFDYNVERSLLIGLLDFIDSLGANTRGVYSGMEEVDALKVASFDSYRDYSFADATVLMESAMDGFAALKDEAMDLKGRALLWIYVTQWVVVTGTSLVCGFVVWTLMVRRRLYREVGTTRLGM